MLVGLYGLPVSSDWVEAGLNAALMVGGAIVYALVRRDILGYFRPTD